MSFAILLALAVLGIAGVTSLVALSAPTSRPRVPGVAVGVLCPATGLVQRVLLGVDRERRLAVFACDSFGTDPVGCDAACLAPLGPAVVDPTSWDVRQALEFPIHN
jgi:hypothetical protein